MKFATIYGFANGRGDILEQCGTLQEKAAGLLTDGHIPLNGEEGAAFGSLCLYAIASAGSADDHAAMRVCRIVMEHSEMLTQDDRAMAMVVADMLRNKQKGMKCPFCQLYEYLKKEDAGCQTRKNVL